MLYLNAETFEGHDIAGSAGHHLAKEVRRARARGFQVVMVHSTPGNDDGCEFGHLFATTPHDLIQDGLYKALALALCPEPFFAVSCCLIAREMGAARAGVVTYVARNIRSKSQKLHQSRSNTALDGALETSLPDSVEVGTQL